MRNKICEGDFGSLKAVLNWNANVFSKHKVGIGCFNFVEHGIELEAKSEACREKERSLEYDMIEPSKSLWACGVFMAKKTGAA